MARPRKYLSKKTCCRCGGAGPFHKNHRAPDGLQYWCKACQKVSNRTWHRKHKKKNNAKKRAYYHAHKERCIKQVKTYAQQHPERVLWAKARARARTQRLPFNIEPTDIVIPKTCPLLGIPLRGGVGVSSKGSPTLDRKEPKRGYVKGNVWVVSFKANTMKQDATLEEIEQLARNLRLEMKS